jgi:hypothetical protein
MATNTTTNERLPISALMLHPDFLQLTPKMQTFLARYVATGLTTGTYDTIGAVMAAYKTTPKNAQIMSYRLLSNKKIAAILDLHFGRAPVDAVMHEVSQALRKSVKNDMKQFGRLTYTTVNALKVYESHTRTADSTQTEPEPDLKPERPASKVGSTVLIDGLPHIVTAVDSQGHATDVEPLERRA